MAKKTSFSSPPEMMESWTRGSGEKLADIALGAHPESFRLEESGPLVFMNLINSYWL